MNTILARIYRISKRLDDMSRRFVFVICLLVLGYSYGYAETSLSISPALHQFLRFDNSTTLEHVSSNIDSTDIDSTDIDSTNNDSTGVVNDSTGSEADSLRLLLQQSEDSTLLSVTDSTDEEDTTETSWTVDAGINYKTKDQKSGIELSGGKPVIGSSVDITHETGLGLSFASAHRITNSALQYQNISYGINYTYSPTKWLDLELELTKFNYSSDTANALAGQTGSISLSADFFFKKFIFDLSVDRYLGTDRQTYFSLSGLWLLTCGDLKISPLASISIVSYEISTKRLKVKTNTIQTVTKKKLSLSSVMASVVLTYPLFSGISATLTPTYSYSPLDELTSKHSQVTATLGISYTIDF